MLQITIPGGERYDEQKEEFVVIKPCLLQLEHSLVSVSKWESKWHKAFLDKKEKSNEELIDYIRCMCITQNVDPEVFRFIPSSELAKINEYISNPMTATWFSEDQKKSGGRGMKEVVTSELIYYWMIALNIPFECQKWHLNRLMTLINVCSIKNTPPKKMSSHDILKRNASLNAARRARLHTKG